MGIIIRKISLKTTVDTETADKRLDQALAILFPQYSRSQLQSWIKAGQIRVDDKNLKAKDKVNLGAKIVINAEIALQERWQPQKIELDVIYEDGDIIIINKPAGLVVHPAAGNLDGTLLNALLYRFPKVATLPRSGIIHRLDKDTSGLMVVTHSLEAHTKLVADLQARKIKREYHAIVSGAMTAGGTIDAPIGRHPRNRKKMTVKLGGKPAITHFRIIARFLHHTYIQVNLETGRTHQIRVHMAHIHYPIVGDQVYAGRLKLPKNASEELRSALKNCKRQMLHAKKLELMHPTTNKLMTFEAPLANDMVELLTVLRIQ